MSLPYLTLSRRSCVSERRYGAANPSDVTALIFYSILLYIAVSTTSYIVSRHRENLEIAHFPSRPWLDARDGRFKIIKRRKFLGADVDSVNIALHCGTKMTRAMVHLIVSDSNSPTISIHGAFKLTISRDHAHFLSLVSHSS